MSKLKSILLFSGFVSSSGILIYSTIQYIMNVNRQNFVLRCIMDTDISKDANNLLYNTQLRRKI